MNGTYHRSMEQSKLNNHYVDWMGFAKPTKDLHLKLSYLLLQQADLLLTTLAIPAGFTELNPLMANLLNTPQKLLMFKLVIPA